MAHLRSLPANNTDRSVRRWVKETLKSSGDSMFAEERECAAIAERLMADLDPRSRLVLEAVERRYDEGELTKLQGSLSRVYKGEPVQRVVGWTEFRGLRVGCSGDVLIPRPETEEVVQWFLEGMEMVEAKPGPKRVLDIGTGSGCVALSIKAERPHWDVVAVDISEAALSQAKANGECLNLEVEWKQVDALNAEDMRALGPFDGVVSNPPYIPQSETLEPHVQDHEPGLALFVPDSEPLLFYEAMISMVPTSLSPGGVMVAECHSEFTKSVADCWKLEGAQVHLLSDLQGAERAVRLVRS